MTAGQVSAAAAAAGNQHLANASEVDSCAELSVPVTIMPAPYKPEVYLGWLWRRYNIAYEQL